MTRTGMTPDEFKACRQGKGYTQAGLTFAFYRAPNWYRNDDDAHEGEDVLPVPILIGPRHYLSDEYRPADTCPPPMDGTPFEVENVISGLVYRINMLASAQSEVCQHEVQYDNRVYLSLRWLTTRRWRPIQDSQP